jgi:hypothetical protein
MSENSEKNLKRLLEIIPASTAWLALFFPIIFSLVWPVAVAIFVLAFDFYWLLKAILMGVHTYAGYLHIKEDEQIDWLERYHHLKNPEKYLLEIQNKFQKEFGEKINFFQRIYWRFFKKNQYQKYHSYLREINDFSHINSNLLKDMDLDNIFQVVLLAVYKEGEEVVFPSIDSYVEASWPKERKILVLALEERALDHAKKIASKVKERYQGKFRNILISFHPDGLPGEIKAKGANVTYAAQNVLKPFLDKEKIPYNHVLVSTFDADTRIHPQYFACLAFKYLTTEKREKRSYQPIPIYSNNIWDTPSITRIIAFGSSFWQMIESTRPYRLVNFSSHAMAFSTLIAIDYWDKLVVNEDSRQFWRAFFKFDGDHRAIPIFTPVYMDAVLSETFWKTLKSQYKQKQRWAYGVEHFSYVVIESIKNKKIPLTKKIEWIVRMFEGYFSWATASIFIATAGWIPLLVNPRFRFDLISLSFPQLVSFILTISWVGVLGSMYISFKLLPPPPPRIYNKKEHYILKKIVMVIQWILMPITGLFFGSLPALDAQTRLALGKYLGFHVTEKVRKN